MSPDVAAKKMSSFKIIRSISDAPAVWIGEQNVDLDVEERATKLLGRTFPSVVFITAPDGTRLIPVSETFKLESTVRACEKQAKQQGYQDGYQAGYDKGLEEAREVMRKFDAAISDCVGSRVKLLVEAQRDVLDIVLMVSRKVTLDALEADREKTSDLIMHVMEQLTDRSKVTIKVHPDFLPVVEQHRDRFLQQSNSLRELRIEADPRVKLGGCLIETPGGEIDARIESQFAVIEHSLRNLDQPV